MNDHDGPLTWSDAAEVVCGGLFVAAMLRVLSGVIQFFNASDGANFRDQVLEASGQLNSITGGLMVGAAVVAVRAPQWTVRLGWRILLHRVNLVLAVITGFAVLSILSLDRPLADKLLSVFRVTLPGMVLFVLAAWLARNVVQQAE